MTFDRSFFVLSKTYTAHITNKNITFHVRIHLYRDKHRFYTHTVIDFHRPAILTSITQPIDKPAPCTHRKRRQLSVTRVCAWARKKSRYPTTAAVSRMRPWNRSSRKCVQTRSSGSSPWEQSSERNAHAEEKEKEISPAMAFEPSWKSTDTHVRVYVRKLLCPADKKLNRKCSG